MVLDLMVEVISKEMRLFALIWVLVLIERCQTVRVQFSTGILEGRSLRVGPRTVNVFKVCSLPRLCLLLDVLRIE